MCLLNDQLVKNPGPTDYNIPPILGSSKKSLVSMKTTKYRDLSEGIRKDSHDSPDMGTYDVDTSKTQSALKLGHFNKSIR